MAVQINHAGEIWEDKVGTTRNMTRENFRSVSPWHVTEAIWDGLPEYVNGPKGQVDEGSETRPSRAHRQVLLRMPCALGLSPTAPEELSACQAGFRGVRTKRLAPTQGPRIA